MAHRRGSAAHILLVASAMKVSSTILETTLSDPTRKQLQKTMPTSKSGSPDLVDQSIPATIVDRNIWTAGSLS